MNEPVTLAGLIEQLRGQEVKEVAALVLKDRALQDVLACWPMATRRVVCDALDPAATLAEAWAAVEVDVDSVVTLCGQPSGIARLAFVRAKSLGLIYPDGSLHKFAQIILQQMIKDAIQRGK